MILLVNPRILGKKFNGMALWPFIILRNNRLKKDAVFINHEAIHLKQQLELGVVFFYPWYLVEYVYRIFQYKSLMKAYRNISFEREAYAKEKDLNYLKTRSFWSFRYFL